MCLTFTVRHTFGFLASAVCIALLTGCVNEDRDYRGDGLGSVDGAYYDAPRPVDYDTYPAYGNGGYYYDRGPYVGGYYGGGRYWRGGRDRDRWHGDGDHRGDHDGGRDGGHRGDHDGDARPRPVPTPGPSGPPTIEKPSYNDMRAGKLNPHINEHPGANRSSNSGHSGGSGGGGKH